MFVESLPRIELDRPLGESRFDHRIASLRSVGRSTTLDAIGPIPPSGARPPGPFSSLRLVECSGRSDA